MRQIFFLLLLSLLTACNHISVTDDEEKADGGSGTEKPATNEQDDAFNVAEILSGKHTDQVVWVKGYIVGYTTGSSLNAAVFGTPDEAENTNFLLADNPNTKDTKAVVPVELPKGAKRDALNLYDHPELLGKRILIEAVVEQYFRVPGLKRLYDYKILSDEEGNEEDPDNPNDKIIIPVDHEATVQEGR